MEALTKLLKNNVNEYELITLWKRKPNNNIALYFYDKYKNEILNIIYSKINRKFSSIPFEKGDLFHIVWNAVLNCLKNFSFEKKINFRSMLINKTYDMSIREISKFLTNKHIVLNTSYSYEHLFDINKNFNLGENGIVKNDLDFNEARKRFIENIIEFNSKYDINLIKKIIYLRSIGYSNRKISKQLKLSYDYIYRIFKHICKIAKKIYY